MSEWQVGWIGAHTPAASAAQAPSGRLQKEPVAHWVLSTPPHAVWLPSQGPAWLIATLAAIASQALSYVVPLQPQTGLTLSEQICGIGTQSPAAPAVQVPTGGRQNCPVAQVTAPVPPHAVPVAQGPVVFTGTPAAWAKQALL
jgi:hypothetical protein